ncbi:MAG: AAA family ATPase [Planctomycetes bacterium]|nr:AAA family ATPase [Planctomycetota bacterium]
MRLDALHVERFGALRGLRVEGLADASLVIFCGPNESGKSTLAAFVESALFGFAPAQLAVHPFAPWDGTPIVGALDLRLADGRAARIERRLSDAPWSRWLVDGRAASLGNAPAPCATAVPRALFRGVHAAPPDDALPLARAAWDDLERRLLLGLVDPRLRTPRDAALALEAEARARCGVLIAWDDRASARCARRARPRPARARGRPGAACAGSSSCATSARPPPARTLRPRRACSPGAGAPRASPRVAFAAHLRTPVARAARRGRRARAAVLSPANRARPSSAARARSSRGGGRPAGRGPGTTRRAGGRGAR